MTTPTSLTVRPVKDHDRADWERLYQGYADFYRVEQTPEMRARVWLWLHDPLSEVEGLVCEDALGNVIGLTHFRRFTRPLAASTGCFLDDLFVSPDARGSGAAQALIGAVRDIAEKRGWSLVRWITAEDNYRGRGAYDKLATRTTWVTYDIKL